MYEICKQAIATGGLPLSTMLWRIDAHWTLGRLTDAQRDELSALARSRAQERPEDSMRPLAERVLTLEESVAALRARLDELEGTGPQPGDEWPEYAVGAVYKVGDRVSWQGKRYECTYYPCSWSPTDYPAAWREVADEAASGGEA